MKRIICIAILLLGLVTANCQEQNQPEIQQISETIMPLY